MAESKTKVTGSVVIEQKGGAVLYASVDGHDTNIGVSFPATEESKNGAYIQFNLSPEQIFLIKSLFESFLLTEKVIKAEEERNVRSKNIK